MDKGDAVVQRRFDHGTVVLRDPKIIEQIPVPVGESGCPKCDSKILHFAEAVVVNERLVEGLGIAAFAQCGNAGCDWQSEAMVRSPSVNDFLVQYPGSGDAAVIGDPKLVRVLDGSPPTTLCPKCRGLRVQILEVAVRHNGLPEKHGVGAYAACMTFGCHWQSSMMVVAR